MSAWFPGATHVASCLNDGASTPCLFTWQTGGFSTVTNATAGVFIYTLQSTFSVDHAEMMPFAFLNAAEAASQLTAFGIVSGSDVAKTVNVLREGALGGASTLVDLSHWLHIWKRPVRT
jgi:hypothetical protein